MKKIQCSTAIVIIISILTAGCKTDPRESIVNKWKLTAVSGDTPDSTKKKMMEKTTIEFTKDGTYILSGTANDQVGTYRFSDDNKWLIITTKDNYTDSSRLDLLSKTSMKVTNVQGSVSMTAVPK